MPTIHDLPTPALILDLDRLERNLRNMSARAGQLGVRLRPHVKSHKCVEIALAQKALGAAGITVSSLEEAAVFARHGFSDITWAFPVILSRLDEVAKLAGSVALGVVVDSKAALEAISALGVPLRVWLKIDCGYHRAGLDPDSADVLDLARSIVEAESLEFAGLLSHSGNAYAARSEDHVVQIADDEGRTMSALSERMKAEGIQIADISVGSTPSATRATDLSDATEMRPGNYALFDYTQASLGSCEPTDCAVTVMATVVSSRADLAQSVLDAGALALSLDAGPDHLADRTYGRVFDDYAAGSLSPRFQLTGLSQEHGHMSGAIPVGDRVRILPNHACTAVACFDTMHVARGDEVVDEWKIWRSRSS
jgi:D-serine deaminase-like pyridoxal phosphate-dependent protein